MNDHDDDDDDDDKIAHVICLREVQTTFTAVV